MEWLSDLCEADGRVPAVPLTRTTLPGFAAMVPEAGVVIVWIVVDRYQEVAVRFLHDIQTGRWYPFGPQ